MAFTLRDSDVFDATASATTIAAPAVTVVAGDVVVVGVKHEESAITITVSDGTSSLTARTKTSHANNDLHVQWFYILSSVANGSVTYTASFNAGAASKPYRSIAAFVFSGADTPLYDTEGLGSGNGTAVASGAMTTASADEIVLGVYGNYGGGVPSPFNHDATGLTGILTGVNELATFGYRILAATTTSKTINGTISSNDWACNGVAFKATAAAGGGLEIPIAVHHYRMMHAP